MPSPKRGRPRRYGTKVDYRQLPAQYLKQVRIAKDIETQTYQAEMLHKEFD